jgi:hypothetical protein
MIFEHCHLVQFYINKDKTIVALRSNPIELMYSNKYASYFWGAARGSRYGVYRDPAATHWGIFNFAEEEKPQLMLHDKFETTPKIRRVYIIEDNYVIMRNFNKYFKFRISEHESVKTLKQTNTVEE